MTDAQRYRLAFAALVFSLVAPLCYQGQRLYELARYGVASADATLILASVHTGFYWRATIAAWFASCCAGIAFAVVRPGAEPSNERRARGIATLLLLSGCLLAVVAWRFP
jgi:Na+/proline symporter